MEALLFSIPDIVKNFGVTDWISVVLIVTLMILYPVYRYCKKYAKHTEEDYSEDTLKRAEEYKNSEEFQSHFLE